MKRKRTAKMTSGELFSAGEFVLALVLRNRLKESINNPRRRKYGYLGGRKIRGQMFMYPENS